MIDAVVVGAGPAGLAASVALADRGVEHVVLERDRVAGTWRAQRWDCFRLNTAGWMNAMLGGQARDAYATRRRGRPAAGAARRRLPGPRGRPGRPAGPRGRRLGRGHRRRRAPGQDGGRRHRRPEPGPGPGAGPPAPGPGRPAPRRRLPRPRPAPRRGGAGRRERPVRLPDRRGPPGRRPPGRAGDQPRRPRALLAPGPRDGRVAGRGRLHGPAAARPARPVGHARRHADHRPRAWPEPAGAGPGRRHPGRASGRGRRRAGRLRRQRGRQRRRRGRLRRPGQGDGRRDHPPPRPGRPARRARRARRPCRPGPAGRRSTCGPRRSAPSSGARASAATSPGSTRPWPAPAASPGTSDGAAPAPGLWYLGLRWLRRRCSGILLGFPGDAAWVADAVKVHLGAFARYRNASRPDAW